MWDTVIQAASDGELKDVLDDQLLREGVRIAINSATKSYRYVLPTHLCAKLGDSTLDCRSIQKNSGLPGAFDARSLCDAIIVPFDRNNNDVLGGSPEPYVNNPLRVPAIIAQHKQAMKDKQTWDALVNVLGIVQERQNPTFTAAVFHQTLIEIHRRLADVTVLYPAPLRISLEECRRITRAFLDESSGGNRPQAVVAALFQVFGERTRMFASVRRGHINAADAASGQAADIECVDSSGKVALAIEVKDKALELRHVQDKIPGLRTQNVSEALFLAFQKVGPADIRPITDLLAKEFISGQNIYIIEEPFSFLSAIWALIGEAGRTQYLKAVGQQLDQYKADIGDRRTWANLLGQL
jgi:hypothetical protein